MPFEPRSIQNQRSERHRSQRSVLLRVPGRMGVAATACAGLFDDLYDYLVAPVRPGRRRAKRDRTTLTVTDNSTEDVPVTEAEIAVFEAWFGGLFDEARGRLADCAMMKECR